MMEEKKKLDEERLRMREELNKEREKDKAALAEERRLQQEALDMQRKQLEESLSSRLEEMKQVYEKEKGIILKEQENMKHYWESRLQNNNEQKQVIINKVSFSYKFDLIKKITNSWFFVIESL
jgi:hypothetical protein